MLGALRVLASGCSFDLVEELSNVDEVTPRSFFHHRFCPWGKGLVDELVNLPRNVYEIRHVTGLFEWVDLIKEK